MKKVLTLIVLIICCLLLSACQTEQEFKQENKQENKIKYDEFLYDEKVSWLSSYTDIVNEYGTPLYVRKSGNFIDVIYDNAYASDAGPLYRVFSFWADTGELNSIYLGSQLSAKEVILKETKQAYAILKKALTAKYGQPDEDNENSNTARWDNIIEDTSIYLDNNIGLILLYSSSRPKAEAVVNSDIPEMTEKPKDSPSPSPVPTSTPNTHGI